MAINVLRESDTTKSRHVNPAYVDKDGNSYTTIEIELWDKVGVLRILAKASGLLDNPEESDKPSVLGINIRAPEIIDHGETTEEPGSDQPATG